MDRLALFSLTMFVLPVFAGCQAPQESKLYGEWQLVAEQAAAEDVEDRVGAGAAGKLIVTFRRDGSLKTQTQFGSTQGEFEGTWEVVDQTADGSEINIVFDLKGDRGQTKIKFLDENRIEMVPPNLVAIKNEIEPMRFEKK